MMLPPRAVHLVIKHFDSIDAVVARRMIGRRPWGEPALTSLLCELLDDEFQSDYNLEYPLEQLNRDLARDGSLTRLSYQVQTHEYGPDLERWVTQSDLGLVINYRDFLTPSASWSLAWLLQAKRLTSNAPASLLYTETSRFGGVDRAQEERMKRLRDVVDVDFVRYLLYCPRPSMLDSATRGKLAYLRSQTLSSEIFDFTMGLEVHTDLGAEVPTLEAGLFVAQMEARPSNLGRLHQGVLSISWPLSWFFIECFLESARMIGPGLGGRGPGSLRSIGGNRPLPVVPDAPLPRFDGPPGTPLEWAHGLVRGQRDAILVLVGTLDMPNSAEFRILPAHTVTIEISVGHDLDPNHRIIEI
jgi:hypothetical protein